MLGTRNANHSHSWMRCARCLAGTFRYWQSSRWQASKISYAVYFYTPDNTVISLHTTPKSARRPAPLQALSIRQYFVGFARPIDWPGQQVLTGGSGCFRRFTPERRTTRILDAAFLVYWKS